MVPAIGIEPISSALQADANPSQLHWNIMVGAVGLEPNL